MNSPRKTLLWVAGILFFLILGARVSHLDAWLWHKFTYTEQENTFTPLSQANEVQEWLELRNENPQVAVSQLDMLFEEQRFEELALVVNNVSDEQKDLVISKCFTVSSGELNLLPKPDLRWLTADDLWFFIQNRGIGISNDEPDGQLFFVYGCTLYHPFHARRFIKTIERYDRRIMIQLLKVLHFSLITAPENPSFLQAYQQCIEFLDMRQIDEYLVNLTNKSSLEDGLSTIGSQLPPLARKSLEDRMRREIGYFWEWMEL